MATDRLIVTSNPQSFAAGAGAPSAPTTYPRDLFNGDTGTGRFHFKFTHTNSSTGRSGYSGLMAQSTGGLWHATNGDFEIYDTADTLLGAHSHTWSAGHQSDYKVDMLTHAAAIDGVSFSISNGNGSLFQNAAAKVGGAEGVSGFGEAGTFTNFDDDDTATSTTLTASGGATFAAVGVQAIQGAVTASGGASASIVGASTVAAALTASGGAAAAFSAGTTGGGDLTASGGAAAAFTGASTRAGAMAASGGSVFAAVGAALVAAVLTASGGATFAAITGQGVTQVAATVKQRINATGSPTGTLTTDGLTTPATGGGFLYFVARGFWDQVASPTLIDSEGIAPGAARAGGPRAYSAYPNAKTAIYYAGGAGDTVGGHTVGAPYDHADNDPAKGDEVTVGMIALLGDGTNAPVLKSSSWVERAGGSSTITSGTVTTSGPGRIYFGVFGSAGIGQLHTFTGVTSGLVKVTAASAEGNPDPNGYVQVTWFYLDVAAAGTYSATFSGTSNEGGQIYAAAFQVADYAQGDIAATGGASAAFVGASTRAAVFTASGGAVLAGVTTVGTGAALAASGGATAALAGGALASSPLTASAGAAAAFVGSFAITAQLAASGGATAALAGVTALQTAFAATGGAAAAFGGGSVRAAVMTASGGATFFVRAPIVPFDPDAGGWHGGAEVPGVDDQVDPFVSTFAESI